MGDLKLNWDQSAVRIPENKPASNYAKKRETLFPRESKICDIGGGNGADAFYFIENGHEASLVDISEKSLAVAQKKAGEKEFKLDTAQVDLNEDTLPFEDESFDIVYSRLTLHFFNIKTTINVLKEVHRVLKKGGKAYITVKSQEDEKRGLAFCKENFEEVENNVFKTDDSGFKTRFSIEQWEEFLKQAGVTNYKVKPYEEKLNQEGDVLKAKAKTMKVNEIILIK